MPVEEQVTAPSHHAAEGNIVTMHGQLVRHQFALSLLPGRPAVSLPQHERIIAATRARDPIAAEAAMREHIASVIDALQRLAEIGLASAFTGLTPCRTCG